MMDGQMTANTVHAKPAKPIAKRKPCGNAVASSSGGANVSSPLHTTPQNCSAECRNPVAGVPVVSSHTRGRLEEPRPSATKSKSPSPTPRKDDASARFPNSCSDAISLGSAD